jgi:hypothetical protein
MFAVMIVENGKAKRMATKKSWADAMNLSLEIKHNQGKQSFVKELAEKA